VVKSGDISYMPVPRLKTFHEDLKAVVGRDPAARSTLEVILCYPGLHAIWFHRISHWLWNHKLKLLGRISSQIGRGLTGIEIHPGAVIGSGFFIDHGMGVVIGETAEVGHNVTLYHGVTLGGVSLEKGKRHPTLQDDVVVGAGAKILGAITIGAGSRVGANAVVTKAVPPNSVVVGVPGQIVSRSKPRTEPDLNHGQLPDTLGESVTSVLRRLDHLEHNFHEHILDHPCGEDEQEEEQQLPHPPEHGQWRGEDFMI
jgi:serine O-acetyltransferase